MCLMMTQPTNYRTGWYTNDEIWLGIGITVKVIDVDMGNAWMQREFLLLYVSSNEINSKQINGTNM